MPNLTAQLSDVQAVDTVVRGDTSDGGGLATGLRNLAQGLGAVSNMFQAQASARRQAAADARAATADARSATEFDWKVKDRAAKDATVRTFAAGLEPPGQPASLVDTSQPDTQAGQSVGVNDPALEASLDRAGRQISSIDAAVTQGKMPAIASEAQKQALFNRILTQHPEWSADVVADTAKGMGIDAFRAYARGTEEVDSQIKANREDREKYVGVGKSIVVPIPGAPEASDDFYYQAGREYTANQAKIKATMDAAAEQRAATSFEQGQSDRVDSQTADVMVNSLVDSFHGALAPNLKLLQQTIASAPEAGKDGGFDAHAAKTLGQLRIYGSNAVNQAIQTLPKNTKPEAVAALRKQLMDNFEQDFIQPFTTRYSDFKAAADAFQTHTGFAAALSYPMIAQMKARGIDYQNMPGIINNIPKEMMVELNRELNGGNARGLDANVGKIHLDRAIAIAQGELNVKEVPDANARRNLLAQSYNVTTAGAAAIAAGKGDPVGWGHNFAQVVLSTGDVKASDGAQTLLRASGIVARTDNRTAIDQMISNPATREQGQLLAHASRAAAGHLTAETKDVVRGQAQKEYYTLSWNRDMGQAILIPDRARWAKDHPQQSEQSMARFGRLPNTSVMPPPSGQLSSLTTSLNNNIRYLTGTAKWDEDAPKGTPRELAAFYAINEPTKAMQAEKAKKKGSTDPNALLDALDKGLSRNPEMVADGGDGVKAPLKTADQIQESYKGKPQYQRVAEARTLAPTYGVPEDIAVRMFHQESGFNPRANSGKAAGISQVSPATARAYGVSDVSALGPTEQMKLGLKILSDNYKKTGNWADAVSMYHSGVDLATARRQHRNDGLINTTDHVDRIVG